MYPLSPGHTGCRDRSGSAGVAASSHLRTNRGQSLPAEAGQAQRPCSWETAGGSPSVGQGRALQHGCSCWSPSPPEPTREAPTMCCSRPVTPGQRRPWPRARRWQAPGAHMVNGSRPRRWAHIWQCEGGRAAPRPAPPLPPSLSIKCISARAKEERPREPRITAGKLPPAPGAGRATQHGGDALGKKRQHQEGAALPQR